MKLWKTLLTILFMATCFSIATIARGQEDPRVVGISIAAPDEKSEYGQSLVPGLQTGVQIHVMIPLPDQYILRLEDEQPEYKISDSSGKALEISDFGNVSFFSNIAEDHKSVVVPFSAESMPGADCTHLEVEGEIVVHCGAEPATEKSEAKLEESGEVSFAGITANIVSVGEGFEENTTQIDFESDQSFDHIQTLVFVDSSGKEHEATPSGSGQFGFGDSMTYSKGYMFEAAAENITGVKVTYFKKVEEVKVPVKVKVSFGLSK